jgi:hypothetical protein
MRYLLPLLFAGLTPIGCRGANDGFVARRDCSNFGGAAGGGGSLGRSRPDGRG